MKKPKLKHRPRRLRARPLLVAAAALTLSAITGCDDVNGTLPQELDMSVHDSAPAHDFGLPPRD